MFNPPMRGALLFLSPIVLTAGSNGFVARAQEPVKSALVVAIEQTRPSVVAIRLPKTANNKKDTSGSGVIVHSDGYLVTNRHVIGSHKAVYVRLHNGKEYIAQVLKSDTSADLALLCIQGQGAKFQPMALDPVEHLWVGEEVLAIGHPYGYAFTASRGIVSAVDREITMPTGEMLGDLIQTDAAINPGNSGGPLINSQGQLIGINVALRDGAQGIAFAIHVSNVRSFVGKHLGVQWLTAKQKPASVPQANDAAPKTTSAEKVATDVQPTVMDEPTPAAEPALPQMDQPMLPAAPVTPTSSGPPLPAQSVASTPFASSAEDGDYSNKPLLVAVIALLLVVIGQQYVILRRHLVRPRCAAGQQDYRIVA